VTTGLAIAVLLAFLSYVRVGTSGIHYRSEEQWQSTTRLFASQGGYPFKPSSQTSADLTAVALIASQFADTDAVKQFVWPNGKRDGKIDSSVVTDGTGSVLPFIDVAGVGSTPARAHELALRAAQAISMYATNRQTATGIPSAKQVTFQVVSKSEPPTLIKGRPKGIPIFVFVAVMCVAIGAVYFLESIRRGSAEAITSGEANAAEGIHVTTPYLPNTRHGDADEERLPTDAALPAPVPLPGSNLATTQRRPSGRRQRRPQTLPPLGSSSSEQPGEHEETRSSSG
jgi:hypothetical protein